MALGPIYLPTDIFLKIVRSTSRTISEPPTKKSRTDSFLSLDIPHSFETPKSIFPFPGQPQPKLILPPPSPSKSILKRWTRYPSICSPRRPSSSVASSSSSSTTTPRRTVSFALPNETDTRLVPYWIRHVWDHWKESKRSLRKAKDQKRNGMLIDDPSYSSTIPRENRPSKRVRSDAAILRILRVDKGFGPQSKPKVRRVGQRQGLERCFFIDREGLCRAVTVEHTDEQTGMKMVFGQMKDEEFEDVNCEGSVIWRDTGDEDVVVIGLKGL